MPRIIFEIERIYLFLALLGAIIWNFSKPISSILWLDLYFIILLSISFILSFKVKFNDCRLPNFNLINLIIALAFVFTFIFEFNYAINTSFWMDEWFFIQELETGKSPVFAGAIHHQPPAFFSFCYLLEKLFNFTELNLRIFTTLIVTSTSFVLFRIVLLLSRSVTFSLIVQAGILFGPIISKYGMEVRQYTMGMFLEASMIFFYLRSINSQNKCEHSNNLNAGILSLFLGLVTLTFQPVFSLFGVLIFSIYISQDNFMSL
jgi:hypothetical protein